MANGKIKLFYKRSPKLIMPTKNRQIIIPFRGISILVIIFLIFICLGLAIRSDLFLIHKIEVEFQNDFGCVSKDEITAELQIQGRSLFAFDSNEHSRVLNRNFSCLEKVEIIKVWPDKLKVMVAERRPVLVLQVEKTSGQERVFDFDLASSQSAEIFLEKLATLSSHFSQSFYVVDSQGAIFKKIDRTNGLPVLRVNLEVEPKMGEKIVGIDFATNLLSKLKDEGFEVEEARMTNRSVVDVFLKEGTQITFSSKRELPLQVSSLQLILTQAKIEGENLKKVDFRFDKPVILK